MFVRTVFCVLLAISAQAIAAEDRNFESFLDGAGPGVLVSMGAICKGHQDRGVCEDLVADWVANNHLAHNPEYGMLVVKPVVASAVAKALEIPVGQVEGAVNRAMAEGVMSSAGNMAIGRAYSESVVRVKRQVGRYWMREGVFPELEQLRGL